MIRYQNASPSALRRPGRSGLMSELHRVRRDRLEALAQELGVEPDLERLRRTRPRATSRSRRRPGSGPRSSARLAKRRRSSVFRCAMTAARRTASSTSPRSTSSSTSNVSGFSWATFGNWPSMRRVVSHASPAPKTTWFSLTPSCTCSAPAATRASSSSARAGMIASAPARRRLRLLHRHPVRVRRRHRQAQPLEADEDAGEHRPGLVADAARDTRCTVSSSDGASISCSGTSTGEQPWEVLGREHVQARPSTSPTRSTRRRPPAVRERHLVCRQQANDVTEQLRRDDDRPSPSIAAGTLVRSDAPCPSPRAPAGRSGAKAPRREPGRRRGRGPRARRGTGGTTRSRDRRQRGSTS